MSRLHSPYFRNAKTSKRLLPQTQTTQKVRPRFHSPFSSPNVLFRTVALLVGWTLFGFVAYKVATTEVLNKVYDPFEILGLKSVRHFFFVPISVHVSSRESPLRRSSRITRNCLVYCTLNLNLFLGPLLASSYSHPDKVKLTANLTMDAVEARFVEITKAYKAYVSFPRSPLTPLLISPQFDR